MNAQSSRPQAAASQEENVRRNQAAIALAQAMARARSVRAGDEAAKAESRITHTARLEAVRHQLMPLYAAIPRDVEQFDLGIVSAEKPRLYVDIIAFIEVDGGGDGFRFVQETRSGRKVLLETDNEEELRDSVTDYIARRLIERERALDIASVPAMPAPEAVVPQPTSIEHLRRSDVPRFTSVSNAVSATTAANAEVPEPAFAVTTPLAEARSKAASVAMPQNANQAFERWTNATAYQDATPLADHAGDVLKIANPAPVLAAKSEDELAALRRELTEISATMAESATVAPQPLVSLGKAATVEHMNTMKDRVVASVVSDSREHVEAVKETHVPLMEQAVRPAVAPAPGTAPVAPLAAAAAVSRTSYAPRPAANPGWWLWPLLAMLTGIGIGALLLYLYAANMLRP